MTDKSLRERIEEIIKYHSISQLSLMKSDEIKTVMKDIGNLAQAITDLFKDYVYKDDVLRARQALQRHHNEWKKEVIPRKEVLEMLDIFNESIKLLNKTFDQLRQKIERG